MSMNYIKLFAKNEKVLELRIYSDDRGMEFGKEKYAMLIMKSGKRHDRRNGTNKLKENQNARRKGNLQILGNIGSEHHQSSGDEKKKKKKIKRVSQENEKTTRNETTWQKSHQRDKYLGCLPRKMLGIILKVDERRTSTNWPQKKKTHNDA